MTTVSPAETGRSTMSVQGSQFKQPIGKKYPLPVCETHANSHSLAYFQLWFLFSKAVSHEEVLLLA